MLIKPAESDSKVLLHKEKNSVKAFYPMTIFSCQWKALVQNKSMSFNKIHSVGSTDTRFIFLPVCLQLQGSFWLSVHRTESYHYYLSHQRKHWQLPAAMPSLEKGRERTGRGREKIWTSFRRAMFNLVTLCHNPRLPFLEGFWFWFGSPNTGTKYWGKKMEGVQI